MQNLAYLCMSVRAMVRSVPAAVQVNMPGHICAVVVTTLVLEGWSSKLDPRHSVLEQVEAIVSPKTSWGQRLGNAVDAVMIDAAPLCDMNL